MKLSSIQGIVRIVSVAVAFEALATVAHAEITLVAEPTNSVAGGSGTFDIDLVNSGPSPVDIGGFSFEVGVSGSSPITFTGVDTNTTSPYIFGTYQSAPFPFSSNTFPNQDLTASDVDFTNPFAVVGAGDSVGLGNVSYTVGSGAPSETVPVTLEDILGATSVSDQNGNNLTFTADNGSITIGSLSATPEPSSAASLAIASIGLFGLILFAGRRKATPAR